MRVRALLVGCLLVAVGLFVSAAVLWAERAEFGWFAYSPLPDEAAQHLLVLTGRKELALALVALGLLLLGSLAGFVVGRRGRAG